MSSVQLLFWYAHLDDRIDSVCQVGHHLLDGLQVVQRHLEHLLGLSTGQGLPSGHVVGEGRQEGLTVYLHVQHSVQKMNMY